MTNARTTDLHIVSWNRPAMTELVIKTIHKNTPRDSFRLVVLDNASEDSTVEMLQAFHDNGLIDEFIPLKTNLGLEAARNLLLHEATFTKRFVCIDNDCLPPPLEPDWLTQMNELMDKYEDYAAISMRTDPMIGTGNIFDGLEDKDIVDFPHPGGSFRIMDTAIALEVGGWDRAAPGRGAEERYICGKLRDKGWKTAFAVQIRALHLFGTENTDRWGYPQDYLPERTGHSDIWHPKLIAGDDPQEIEQYAGKALTDDYLRY